MGFSGANWESVSLSGGQLGYYGSVGGGGGGGIIVSVKLSEDQWGSIEVSGA